MVERHDAKDPGKVRVLFVSQDENDIKKALQTAAVIALGPTDNENDIRSFVREWTLKIQKQYELDNRQVEYVMDSTCARARGNTLGIGLRMFLRRTHRHVSICEVGYVQLVCATYASAFPRRDQSNQIPAGTWTSVSHVEDACRSLFPSRILIGCIRKTQPRLALTQV